MKGLPSMTFNTDVSIWKNIEAGLLVGGKTTKKMAEDLGTTTASIKTVIGEEFRRKGRTPPLHGRVFNYLIRNCSGFEEHARTNQITIASSDPV